MLGQQQNIDDYITLLKTWVFRVFDKVSQKPSLRGLVMPEAIQGGLQQYYANPPEIATASASPRNDGYPKTLKFFYIGYVIYLVSHFFCQKAIYSSLLFYFAAIAPMICFLFYSRTDFKTIASSNKLLIFLILYLLIHSLVMAGEMQLTLAIKGIRNIVATSLFLTASLLFFHKSNDQIKHSLFVGLSITSGVFALASILLYQYSELYINHVRLVPLGFARHEILGASLYGTAGIISLYLALSSSTVSALSARMTWGAISVIIFFMILMTFSRGPILAYIASSGLAILFFSKNLRQAIVFCSLAILLIAALLLAIPEYYELLNTFKAQILERGTSYRLTLWKLTIDRIIERPILGYGVRNIFESDVPGGHSPHNIYLSTAYYFGIPALLILIGVIIQAIRRALTGFERGNYNALLFILLTHALFSVITDHGQLVRGNTPVWIIFWLPICMCLAYKHAKHKQGHGNSESSGFLSDRHLTSSYSEARGARATTSFRN